MPKVFDPPEDIPLSSILPTEPMLLMGAGPVPIPHAVAQANGVVINHLGKTMDRVIERLKIMAQYAFQTKSDKVLGVAGPASAAMEMAVTNLIWPGKKVLVLKNGTFSARFGEMVHGVGASYVELEPQGGIAPFTAEAVRNAFARESFDVVTMVQGETSCGVLNAQIPEIAEIARENNALMIVDAVCTLTTMPLYMDKWHIDVVVAGGQKGLSSIPGVSLIAFSDKAWDEIEHRDTACPHWCLDAARSIQFWAHQQYHYTAPVPGILALHEALRIICDETLEKRFERHLLSSQALQAGIEAMGMKLFVPEKYRLNSVVAIEVPDNVDDARAREYMADTFNVEIAGAFGLNIVRIGQMGEQCRANNLFKVLYAMGVSFQREGLDINVANGMAALETSLGKDMYHFVN